MNEELRSEPEAEIQAGTITRDSNGRDDHGRFKPGCQAGPGRPKYLTRRELCEFFKEKVTERDMNEILRDAVERAKDGDYRAREWVFRTVKAAEREIDRMDSSGTYSLPDFTIPLQAL
jgi:hypothetical protein